MRAKALRRARVALGAACLASVTIAAPMPASVAGADPTAVGAWAGPVGLGIIGVHAALLPSGDVLFYELPGSTLSRARVFDPRTGATRAVDPNIPWSVFCSGMSFMADGRLFATGGEPPRTTTAPMGTGTAHAAFFHPSTGNWTAAPPMAYPRWYPSNVQMPDGTTLVLGGERAPTGPDGMIDRLESYDPAANRWTTLPSTASVTGLYPRAHLAPGGKVAIVGPQRASKWFDPATNTVTTIDEMNAGSRKAGGVVPLLGARVLLTSGGKSGSKPVTATSEVIDLGAASPQWAYSGPMRTARMHHNLVLLPDGSVLAVGGTSQGSFGSPVKTAELYDPSTGTWTTMAAQVAVRGYHSTALLLPDGRVISAGSNSGKREQTKVEIFSPPYLFRGARPALSGVPDAIGFGSTFGVSTPDPASIVRVTLIRTGATTHGWNFEQRGLELAFERGAGELTITAPARAALAPVGDYMLFLIDGNGVPSVARIVHLG